MRTFAVDANLRPAGDLEDLLYAAGRQLTEIPELDEDPEVTHLLECADMITQQLPSYTANTIHSGLMAFVNEELSGRDDGYQIALKPDAYTYIEYSRYKNGLPEPFAACIWPMSMCPDVNEYIQAFP